MNDRTPDTSADRLAAIKRTHEDYRKHGHYFVEGFEAVDDLLAMLEKQRRELERERSAADALRAGAGER